MADSVAETMVAERVYIAPEIVLREISGRALLIHERRQIIGQTLTPLTLFHILISCIQREILTDCLVESQSDRIVAQSRGAQTILIAI